MARKLGGGTAAIPVVGRSRIGEQIIGGIAHYRRRPHIPFGKDDPEINPKTGKPKMEAVFTVIAVKGDMCFGGALDKTPIVLGNPYRLIFAKGAYSQLIDAEKEFRKDPERAEAIETADLIRMTTSLAIVYLSGDKKLETADQAELDAFLAKIPPTAQKSVAFRGAVQLKKRNPNDPELEERCDQLYDEVEAMIQGGTDPELGGRSAAGSGEHSAFYDDDGAPDDFEDEEPF